MSWEEMSVEKHPCPCGKGTYSVRHRTDDWNRTDTSLSMDCEDCYGSYVIYSENTHRGGLPYTVRFWIKVDIKAEYNRLSDEVRAARDQVRILRIQRYLSKWLALFSGKNKKQVWELLTNKGERYPALGTFYQHTKEEGLIAYLERHFKSADDRAFNEILKFLCVEDAELAGLMERAATIEQDAHNLVWQKRFPQ